MMKKKGNKKYFIKIDNDLRVVSDKDFFKSLSLQEAFIIGLSCYLELNSVLKKDAVDDLDSYVGKLRVVTGLQRSLQELCKLYPNFLTDIRQLELSTNGQKVFYC